MMEELNLTLMQILTCMKVCDCHLCKLLRAETIIATLKEEEQ